jgi:flagellar hook protein FlgE
MSFNTALSGIRAADTDLKVTGNNIANAGTIGFKGSRAEFGDVYTSSLLGGGSATPGSGVTTLALRQSFSQGNLKFTQNALDLAVNGSGFFVMSDNGNQLYSRAGAFGLDKDGYIVGSTGALLQGFAADANGNVSGILGNLKVDVSTQAPRQTTGVDASFNLDSRESVKETIGSSFVTNGGAVGVAQLALKDPTTTTSLVGSVANPLTFPMDFAADPTEFSIKIAGSVPATGDGTQTIKLNAATLGTATTITSLEDLADVINAQLYASTPAISVIANVDTVANQLVFNDTIEGAPSNITFLTTPATIGTSALSDAVSEIAALAPAAQSVPGIPAVTNDYDEQTLVIKTPTGTSITYTSTAGASAADTASAINDLSGISATATTTATITGATFDNTAANLEINGVRFSAQDIATLAQQINAPTSALSGVTAAVVGTNLVLTSARGDDLHFAFNDGSGDIPPVVLAPGSIEVTGADDDATAQTLNTTTDALVVGGTIEIVMEEGYSIVSSTPVVGNLFAPFQAASFTPVPMNSFDPNDQKTYNHATSSTIYDSLGNSHLMRSYFVKQEYDVNDPTTVKNHWKMYVQIDGQNVGDPDPTLPVPNNTAPTMAGFNVYFNEDGSLDESLTDSLLISNWTPIGADGRPLGALAPLNVLQGGTIPVAEPPSSSNFVIDLSGSTQFGSVFSVENLDQNGYTTGRLAGLDVDARGILFARFTNGEAQTLGQVALANFNNIEGLKPVGNTMWAQTFETGEPVIGAPGSASLGDIHSGALEESNVDLSEQLVNLIIAQRNYQANAKTIETANATTQTIINLR